MGRCSNEYWKACKVYLKGEEEEEEEEDVGVDWKEEEGVIQEEEEAGVDQEEVVGVALMKIAHCLQLQLLSPHSHLLKQRKERKS